MNTTGEIREGVTVQSRVKGAPDAVSRLSWSSVRFLAEDEIISLMQKNSAKTEAEARKVLESFERKPWAHM